MELELNKQYQDILDMLDEVYPSLEGKEAIEKWQEMYNIVSLRITQELIKSKNKIDAKENI